MSSRWNPLWDPDNITLRDTSVPKEWKLCVLQHVVHADAGSKYGGISGRIVAIFVIFITSLLATLIPVLTQKSSRINIPEVVYITAKNFGTGVIVATALVHLVDPALQSMGPNACVGITGGWGDYRWGTAFMLFGAVLTFLVDIYSQFFNDRWYGTMSGEDEKVLQEASGHGDFEFRAEFTRFLILEVGVVVHSVFIGLTLGSSEEWVTLFIVIVFHQAFEGLGIGARMSMIAFPDSKWWWPYLLSFAYSITTPVSIALGIVLRHSYRNNGFSQMKVQGICDAISCGIMIYTGFVELLAREFIFADLSDKSLKDLNTQLFSIVLGAGLMSVIGKWA